MIYWYEVLRSLNLPENLSLCTSLEATITEFPGKNNPKAIHLL